MRHPARYAARRSLVPALAALAALALGAASALPAVAEETQAPPPPARHEAAPEAPPPMPMMRDRPRMRPGDRREHAHERDAAPHRWRHAEMAPRAACAARVHLASAMLGGLHSRLRLTAEQAPAWAAFETAARAGAAEILAFCDTLPAERAPATLSERMARAERAMEVGLAALREVRGPLEALHAVLTPAQRAELDRMRAFRGPF